MGETEVRGAVDLVLAALRGAGRSEVTIRGHEVVLDRFTLFLAGRGLGTVSERVCIDFVENQTGVRLGSLREAVNDRDVKAVRRPVVLLAEVLAGRPVDVGRSVIAVKDGCPVGFRQLRDDYLARCRARGNAEATVVSKDKRPAGSWPISRRWASMIWLGSASGTSRASSCASDGCGERRSRQ